MRVFEYATRCLEYQLRDTDKENPPRELVIEAFLKNTGFDDEDPFLLLSPSAFFFCECGAVMHRIKRDA